MIRIWGIYVILPLKKKTLNTLSFLSFPCNNSNSLNRSLVLIMLRCNVPNFAKFNEVAIFYFILVYISILIYLLYFCSYGLSSTIVDCDRFYVPEVLHFIISCISLSNRLKSSSSRTPVTDFNYFLITLIKFLWVLYWFQLISEVYWIHLINLNHSSCIWILF